MKARPSWGLQCAAGGFCKKRVKNESRRSKRKARVLSSGRPLLSRRLQLRFSADR